MGAPVPAGRVRGVRASGGPVRHVADRVVTAVMVVTAVTVVMVVAVTDVVTAVVEVVMVAMVAMVVALAAVGLPDAAAGHRDAGMPIVTPAVR